MDEQVKWVVGQLFAGAVALFGYHKTVDKRIKDSESEIHTRINDVRQEYVRRDDFKEWKDDVRSALHRIENKLDGSGK